MRRPIVLYPVFLFVLSAGAIAQAPPPVHVETIPTPGERLVRLSANAESQYLFVPAWLPGSPTGDDNGVDLGVTDREETFSQQRRSLAELPGGGFAAIWQESRTPPAYVRLQYVLPSGATVFPDGGLILANYFGGGADLAVAPHPSSGVYVAFRRSINATSDQVQVQWIDGDGQRRWTDDGVAAFGPAQAHSQYSTPDIVANPAGGAFVCAAGPHLNVDTTVKCQRIAADGTPQWAPGGLPAGGVPGWRILPKVVSDGGDGVLVFWKNNRTPSDGSGDRILIEGQRFSAAGDRLWGPGGLLVRTTNLAEFAAYRHAEFDAVPDGLGGAIVGFEDWNGVSPATRDVFAQRVSADGSLPWNSGIPVATGGVAQQFDSITAVYDGGAVVGSRESYPPDRSQVRIYRLDADGAHVWGTDGLSLSDPAALASNYGSFGDVDDERVHFAWIHQKQPGTFTHDIYAAEYTLSGMRLVPPEGVPLFDGELPTFVYGFAHDAASGRSLAVFDEYDPFTPQWNTRGALFPATIIFRDGFD